MNSKTYIQKSNLQKQVDGLQLLLERVDTRLKEVEAYLKEELYEPSSECSDEDDSLEEYVVPKKQKFSEEISSEKK